jgi:hypothetical protein
MDVNPSEKPNIHIHNIVFVKEVTPILVCGKPVLWQVSTDGAYTEPVEIQPTEGRHDFNVCEVCQSSITNITTSLTVRLNGDHAKKGFPHCCEEHINLTKLNEFRRDKFENAPNVVARKVVYTVQHFINNCEEENWFKKCFDYVEWAVLSFGYMPNNCGEPLFLTAYFFYVEDLMKRNTLIPIEKRKRLSNMIQGFKNNDVAPRTDINILAKTYEKWLSIFPFDISTYFGPLKEKYYNTLPFLNGEPEINMYSGISKTKLHTKESLINACISMTNDILIQINAATLYEKGELTDIGKVRLELAIHSRKMKLGQGYKNSSPQEDRRYRRILKEWFKDEKDFIKELTSILGPQPVHSKVERVAREEKIPFEQLFYNPQHAEVCLDILKQLEKPVLDEDNNYIGTNKGVFPLWIKILKMNNPKPLIKHQKDLVYKDSLNSKVNGLNLSKDASEFRKNYTRLNTSKIDFEIKVILSEFSQQGRFGK